MTAGLAPIPWDDYTTSLLLLLFVGFSGDSKKGHKKDSDSRFRCTVFLSLFLCLYRDTLDEISALLMSSVLPYVFLHNQCHRQFGDA